MQGKVIIGPKGNIDGEIKAQNAVIEGQFRGSLFIEDLLHIKETAQVEGEINTDKLSVAPGARFNVLSKMSTSSSGPAPLPKKEQ
ncbi:MAG: polymer-forming cytoskeletal protein [Saprospiraceae bacterium]|nr:polymer-forming cytoskeletal protein [Saprospiraceae bacterium]